MEGDKKPVSIVGMYYRYNTATIEEIQNCLDHLKIVKYEKGKYYPLTDDSINRIKESPRTVSLTFGVEEDYTDQIDLIEKETITYLVKGTRFYLKPTIGEIFDQINISNLDKSINAICYNGDFDYETIPETNGEHHLMKFSLCTINN